MAKIILKTTDVEEYRNISANFDEDKFNSFAKEVQKIQLKNLLGQALYKALLDDLDANGDPQTEPFITLVDGGEYEYDNDLIDYSGIRAYLAYHWLGLNVRQGDFFQAEYGNIQFNDNPQDNMTKLSSKDIDRINADYMTVATNFRNEIVQYLNENSTDFPTWKGKDENESTTSFNILTV